jgi:hypothetical protein
MRNVGVNEFGRSARRMLQIDEARFASAHWRRA